MGTGTLIAAGAVALSGLTVVETVTQNAALVAALAAGLAGLLYLAKAAAGFVRRAADFVDRVNTLVDLTDHELRHNGGSTIKDAVSRIPSLEGRIARMEVDLKNHIDQMTATQETS